ncbi:hypothetical protein RyT2_09410 [Pseudolactococcus yaeyamensis]
MEKIGSILTGIVVFGAIIFLIIVAIGGSLIGLAKSIAAILFFVIIILLILYFFWTYIIGCGSILLIIWILYLLYQFVH